MSLPRLNFSKQQKDLDLDSFTVLELREFLQSLKQLYFRLVDSSIKYNQTNALVTNEMPKIFINIAKFRKDELINIIKKSPNMFETFDIYINKTKAKGHVSHLQTLETSMNKTIFNLAYKEKKKINLPKL